jgi:hypothetical protein
MAGARTPASPGTPTTAPASKGTPGPGSAVAAHQRSEATGDEAGYLREAHRRLDSVAGVLSAAAVGHIGPEDLVGSLAPIVALVDQAARLVALAGGDE